MRADEVFPGSELGVMVSLLLMGLLGIALVSIKWLHWAFYMRFRRGVQ